MSDVVNETNRSASGTISIAVGLAPGVLSVPAVSLSSVLCYLGRGFEVPDRESLRLVIHRKADRTAPFFRDREIAMIRKYTADEIRELVDLLEKDEEYNQEYVQGMRHLVDFLKHYENMSDAEIENDVARMHRSLSCSSD